MEVVDLEKQRKAKFKSAYLVLCFLSNKFSDEILLNSNVVTKP